jgi:LPXTG-motif cell wall-anchored protein
MNTTTLFAILGLVVIAIVVIVYWRRRRKTEDDVDDEEEETSFEQTETATEEDEEVEIDASATYDRNNIVQIRNQYGGCMSLPDANNGTAPWIQKCNSADVKQRWLYDANATRLKSALGSCIADKKKNGVVGWVCEDESDDQRWKYNAADGSFERVDEGTCLETDSNENDSEIRASACARGASQRWFVKKVAYIK